MATSGEITPQLPILPLLKEGYLLKRQRGQRSKADLRGLKFQQRFICLTQDSLCYFVDRRKGEKKGEFPVARMRIIEKVPDATFQRTFCFQIGDEKEVMYFKAKSENERKEWIETIRIAATLKGNVMLDNYHTGAYGQVHQLKWSCCSAANRDTPGCQQTLANSGGSGKQPRRMTSLKESHSGTGKATVSHRPFVSLRGRPKPQQRHRSPSPIFHDAIEAPEETAPTSHSLATYPTSPLSEFEQEGSPAGTLEELMRQDSQDDSIDGDRTATNTLRSSRCSTYDSGVSLDSSSRYGGSQMSILSGPGMSLSPPVSRRQNVKASLSTKETIPESEAPLETNKEHGGNPEVQERRAPTWKCWDIPLGNSQSEIISTVFRRIDTLITAHEDGSVKQVNIAKLEGSGATGLKNIYTDTSCTIGSIDIWKYYLAIGLPELKLVNLDNDWTLHIPTEDRAYPHLVAFTPRGNLLSYNQSQPNVIKTWPKVESSWSSLDIESESLLEIKDDYIDSLLVSPNPSQPWLAVSTTNIRQLQVYNYETHDLKYQLDADYEKAVISFAPDGKYIAIAKGRSLAIHDIESCAIICHFPELGVSITSLAYNPWPEDTHLAIGLNNGEIKVYSGLLNSAPELLVSLDKSKASRSITCLAYSNDGLRLAAGSTSGKLKLWKVRKPSKFENGGISLVREGELKVDSKGNQYVSPDDGYVISVPPGAVAEGKTVTLKYGVVPDGPFGPFEFPDGVRPVSAILSLHPTTKESLLKPIEIALPHFIHCETQKDQKRLAVYKADCHRDIREGSDGKIVYCFRKMADVKLSLGAYKGDFNYPEGIPYGKYSTDHYCYWCIGEYGRDETDRAIFSLIEVKPKVLDQLDELVIHFCIPYFLPTCHKTIREQYPESAYDLSIQTVKFSSDASIGDPAICIHFREKLGGWLFSLQGGYDKKIYQQEVCFWDAYPSPYYLKEMCEEKLYPPRFSVRVRGAVRPNDVVKAEFTFPGAEVFQGRGQPVSIIHLPLQAQRSLFTGTSNRSSRMNSVQSNTSEMVIREIHSASPSTQQSLQPVARAFKACMCDMDNLHPAQLAMNLFSKDLIDEDYFESIQESMESTGKTEVVINKILLKMYNDLKADTKLYTPFHEILKKLSPDSAKKFASVTTQLSREGSVASTHSYATTQDRLSTEAEPLTDVADGVFSNPVYVANGSVLSSPTLTPYVPIQNDNERLLTFCSQMSHSPADPSSVEAETAERPTPQAMFTPTSD